MNYSNLAQKTNWIAGSDKFKHLPFYLTFCNIPGINFNHPDAGGSGSAKLNLQGDTLTYNPLSIEVLLDEDFIIYHEFMEKIEQSISVDNASFAPIEFDFWIQINNNNGHKLFKMEFYNCRIENIADIILDSTDETTEYTLPIDIRYDYYKRIPNNILLEKIGKERGNYVLSAPISNPSEP
jgi:hypothetical protein